MNAIGYIRLSEKDQSNFSIDEQERRIRQYCARYSLSLEYIFVDNGADSYTFDRADFRALEKYIKQFHPQYIIVAHLDRFSRNMAEAILKIRELLTGYKVRVRDVTEDLGLDETDPNVFMMRSFRFMMAENELHRIRERTRAGINGAKLSGRHINMAPFGYINSKDEQKKCMLVIDEEKAGLIRTIYKEYLAGRELEEIKKHVSALGFKQKGRSSIRRVLENSVYAGLIFVPAYKGMKAKHVSGLHIPIVSEQDYWLCQERLQGKGITIQKKEEVPLRGSLHCWCGRLVTAGNSRSKSGNYYWYYLCQEHRKNLSAIKLHNQFNELLDNLSFSPEDIEWFREKMSKQIGDRLNERGNDIARVKQEIKTITARIQRVEEKYLLEPVSDNTYKSVITNLRADLSRYQVELTQLNTNQQAYWDRLGAVLPKLSNLREVFAEMDLVKKQQFINLVFDKNLFYRDGTYRTPKLHELFAPNELVLKEKGLLIIEKPSIKMGEKPMSTNPGTHIEQIHEIFELFEMIA